MALTRTDGERGKECPESLRSRDRGGSSPPASRRRMALSRRLSMAPIAHCLTIPYSTPPKLAPAQSPIAPLRTVPLDAWHRRLGARMVAFAGYEMPVQYDFSGEFAAALPRWRDGRAFAHPGRGWVVRCVAYGAGDHNRKPMSRTRWSGWCSGDLAGAAARAATLHAADQ